MARSGIYPTVPGYHVKQSGTGMAYSGLYTFSEAAEAMQSQAALFSEWLNKHAANARNRRYPAVAAPALYAVQCTHTRSQRRNKSHTIRTLLRG
jgi:hypothetical protein